MQRSQAVSELKRMVQECREWNVTEVRDVAALRALLEGQSERTGAHHTLENVIDDAILTIHSVDHSQSATS